MFDRTVFGSVLMRARFLVNFVVQFSVPKRGGGYAILLRFGSAAPGLVPAHGVQSPIL